MNEATSMNEDQRVLIAGAGPVGCTAALMLARSGIPVTLIESEPTLVEDLRGSTFHPPSLDMLDDLGVTEKLIPQGLVAPKYQFRDRTTGAYAEFDLGVLEGCTRHPFRLQCEQFKLTRTILPMLQALPASDVRFSTSVQTITQNDQGVSVVVETPDGPETLTGRYLIGTDGARSTVRRQMEIELEGFTYPELFLVVSTDFPFEDHLEGLSYVNYISDPEEWCTLLRVPDFWRALFPTDPNKSEDELVDPDTLQAKLGRLASSDAPFHIEHTTLYRIHQRVARQYRKGNVLLAGDACHLNNPLGGMGMNGGLHDAVNACEKIIRIFHDGASEDLLDLYERQRRGVTIEFVQSQTMQNKKNIEQAEDAARLQHIASLNEMIAKKDEAITFLRRNNMIDAVERSYAIT